MCSKLETACTHQRTEFDLKDGLQSRHHRAARRIDKADSTLLLPFSRRLLQHFFKMMDYACFSERPE